MKTYPLESISVEKAIKNQFRLIDCVTNEFNGIEILSGGDMGVVKGYGKPKTTQKVEKVIANFFGAQRAILVRGSGTGAIKWGLHSIVKGNQKILIHNSPIYSTTKTTIEMLGINTVMANFNDLENINDVLANNSDVVGVLIQHTRQAINDSYNLEEVIKTVKAVKDIPVLVDDNYAVMKTPKSGVELGADLSCFSTFKLLGPEGIGCIVGSKKYINYIEERQYSGGSQVQGSEALEVLRGMVYAPVSLAIQAKVIEELFTRINAGEIEGVKRAVIANAQSKVLIVEFEEPIAKKILGETTKLGGLEYPVGAESKYEFSPLFYRLSGTFLRENPDWGNRMIRINPNRSGANTVIRILKLAMKNIEL